MGGSTAAGDTDAAPTSGVVQVMGGRRVKRPTNVPAVEEADLIGETQEDSSQQAGRSSVNSPQEAAREGPPPKKTREEREAEREADRARAREERIAKRKERERQELQERQAKEQEEAEAPIQEGRRASAPAVQPSGMSSFSPRPAVSPNQSPCY